MNATTTLDHEATAPRPILKSIGLPGRVAVTWTMAGGVVLGGVLVAAMTLAGRLSGHGLFVTATGLFLIGSLLGALHGAVLGYLGRPAGMDRREALHCVGRAGMYAVPGSALAWLLTIWVAMTLVAAMTDGLGATVLVAVAWMGSAAVLAWAAVSGTRALVNAYARWPQRNLGTVVVAASFGALLIAFLADRPMMWLLRMRVTEVGAVLLAAAVTLWVVGPLVTVALRMIDELPGRNRARVPGAATASIDIALGLVVGTVVGLLAVPFTPAGAVTGAAGGVAVAVGQALVDEVLLRMVLLSGVAWAALRWHRVHPEEAALLAVVVVAAAQVILYLPGILATGFPTTVAAVAFTGVAVVLPALVFGALFWTRGFGSAVVAHAAAAVALLLLV